jgi:hypothetical protein
MKTPDHLKPHLTSVNPGHDAMVAKTPPGMAHWAGTGPAGTTCRECVHYQFSGYKSKRGGITGGTLKLGICNKYLSMMKSNGAKVPFETPSCKYFELNKQPPATTDPRKD